LVIFCRTDEDIKYIEINFQTRVFLPVEVKPFFASLDNLQEGLTYIARYVQFLLQKFLQENFKFLLF